MRDRIARLITGSAIGAGILGLLFFALMGTRKGNEPPGRQGSMQSARPVPKPILVSAFRSFANLQRAPVKFDHDRHTAALKPEGCVRCHARNESGLLVFTFPKSGAGQSAGALMNSFHDECIGCHRQRTAESKKAGPDACGECHRVENETSRVEYTPNFPEHYDTPGDTYHKDCLACHREPAQPSAAESLNWKSFAVRERRLAETAWSRVVFDYSLHDKHDRALGNKCEACHFISAARKQKLAAEGRQPTNRDWLLDIDPADSLTGENAAHTRCINCHESRRAEGKRAGPAECGGCHGRREPAIREMADIPRPECDQSVALLIQLNSDARAKAVAFDHKSHQDNSRSCQDCHHKTLRACGDCHTLQGSKDGGGVTLAEAYHRVSSSFSCIGCHQAEKRIPACSGCHDRLASGLVQSACDYCHSDSLSSLKAGAKLPSPKELLPEGTKDEIVIGLLQKEYRPSKMPHLAIATKLTEISNQSSLATYFHRDQATICAGCHHRTPIQVKSRSPQCATCHAAVQQTVSATPTLLGGYHQQCLGCHKQMVQTGKKLPQNCTGCHEEKPKGI